AAPFNALLAEQVEYHLTGSKPPSEGQNLVTLIVESTVGEIKKLIYILLRMLPILLLFLIPGVNLIAPFVWFIFSAWMLTLEYADYPMGNHDIDFKQQRATLKKQRLMSLTFGSSALFFTTLPFVNLIAMPVSVAGATSLFVARLHNR
ncbi:MAG: sulfate transporter CysZ, partial [Gammaproteobacteria bacterium]|nr:sulfate transporter CysZ [Gammaproteobacteria bacterium]